MRASLGAGQGGRDLGAVGVAFAYPALKLAGIFSGPQDDATVVAIFVDDGADTKTAGGVTVGSAEAAVQAEFGAPVVDPFVKAWWYRPAGIAFQWDGAGKVARIQLAARVE